MATKPLFELPRISAEDVTISNALICTDILNPETSIINFNEYFKYSVRNFVVAGDGFSKTENSDGTFTFAGAVQPTLSKNMSTGSYWISYAGSNSGISFNEANGLSVSMAPINYGTGTVAAGKSHVLNMTLTNWGKSFFSDTLNIGGVTSSANNYLHVSGSVFDYPHPFVVTHRGRVGVNNPSPVEFLDVIGNASIDGTVTATGNIATLGYFIGKINWSNVEFTPGTLAEYGIEPDDPYLDKINYSEFNYLSVTTAAVDNLAAIHITHNSANNIIEAHSLSSSPHKSFTVTNECNVVIAQKSGDVVDINDALTVFGDLRVTGNIDGNITGSDITANNIIVDSDVDSVATQYLTYVETSSEPQKVKINDSDLKYQRSTQTLTATNIEATTLNVTNNSTFSKNLDVYETANVNVLKSNNSSPATTYAEVIGIIYPVGSIYTSTNSTNPGTLFGVGTWTAYGQGRVLVGAGTGTDKNSTSKTFTVGTIDTEGEYGHRLTPSETANTEHTHIATDGGHTHPYDYAKIVSGGAWDGGGQTIGYETKSTSSGSANITVSPSAAANAQNTHNNIQPYVTVYMWHRTA